MLNFYHFFDRFLIEKTPFMPKNPEPRPAFPAVPPKPPYIRLRLSLQLQTLQASLKALSVIPPGGQRIPPGRPRGRTKFTLLSIKILIIFGHRFLIDLGRLGAPSSGHFGAFWRPR